ncbi:MAG: hypothetical protein WBX15_04490 [Thermoanaerobaculia bacterium]
MLNMIKKLFYFRLGQKTGRGAARTFGLKYIAPVIGLIVGYRLMRKHS